MTWHGDKGRAELHHINIQQTRGLRSINNQRDMTPAANGGDLLNRKNEAATSIVESRKAAEMLAAMKELL